MGKHVIHGEEVIPGESGGKNRWKKTRRGNGETRPRYNLARIEILCCFCAFVVNVCAKRAIGKKLTKNSSCVFFFFLAPCKKSVISRIFLFFSPNFLNSQLNALFPPREYALWYFVHFSPPPVQMKQLNKLAGFAFRCAHFANPSSLAHLPEHAWKRAKDKTRISNFRKNRS